MSVQATQAAFVPRLGARRAIGSAFHLFCVLMLLLAVAALGILLVRVVMDGWAWLSMQFLTSFPSILNPESGGIKHALHGTIWLIVLTGVVSVPLGIGAAVYLQEYASSNRLTRFIQLNIANLAGVPSIVYGILGLAVFVRSLALGRSVIAGALTMSLLILPVIIIASKEALAAVPNSIRLAAYALGATRWQVVRHHVLPAAAPGIMTGIILALSRAIGEAAPLIMLGALNYVPFVPTGLTSPFSALPIQIFSWTGLPQPEFHHLAAAAIIVLLAVLLTMNAVAIGIRMYQQKDRL
ncbi:MAG TPA: phosphate ABC transporter permease PstA [Phycisphaerae bacterium]|nr:phosphate ABC transporter permease PstA [Phycisphaerae bacterium]